MTKLLRVEAYDKEPYGSLNGIHFAFMSSQEKGRKQCHRWLTCRDFLNDVLRSHVNEDKDYDYSSHYKFGIDPPIDFEKCRLLIGQRFQNGENTPTKQIDEFKEKLFAGKRIINLYEDMAGWDRSKITTVHHSLREKKVWLLTSPKEWMTSSHMVSMLTLIMRVAVNYGPLKIETEEDLQKCWKILIKNHEKEKKKGVYNLDMDIAEYIKKGESKFPLLMKNFDKIFGNLKQKDLYSKDLNNFHAGGGIHSLCSYGTGIGKLDDLCETYLEGET
jgi:hypothetical protein